MIMGMNRLANLKMNQDNKFSCRVLVLSISMVFNTGCARADAPSVYRESQGKVEEFTVEQFDRTLRITAFIQLQDGTVIHPTVYYYQVHKTLIGVRKVEKPGRLWRTFGRDRDPLYRKLHLPRSKEIALHLIMVRRSFHKDSVPKYVIKAEPDPLYKILGNKTDYVWANWQLLEIEAKDLSPNKPLVIPAYEELAKREQTKEQKELLEDLVQRYDKTAAAARKRAATPTKPGDKKPWWRW